MVPSYHRTIVTWYHHTIVPSYHSTTIIPLYHNITVPLYYQVSYSPTLHVLLQSGQTACETRLSYLPRPRSQHLVAHEELPVPAKEYLNIEWACVVLTWLFLRAICSYRNSWFALALATANVSWRRQWYDALLSDQLNFTLGCATGLATGRADESTWNPFSSATYSTFCHSKLGSRYA